MQLSNVLLKYAEKEVFWIEGYVTLIYLTTEPLSSFFQSILNLAQRIR